MRHPSGYAPCPRRATARGSGTPRARAETRGETARAASAEGPARRRTRSRRDRPPLDHLQHAVERLAHREPVGLHDRRVGRWTQRRDRARAVELVAAKDLREQLLPRATLAARGELLLAPLRALR